MSAGRVAQAGVCVESGGGSDCLSAQGWLYFEVWFLFQVIALRVAQGVWKACVACKEWKFCVAV